MSEDNLKMVTERIDAICAERPSHKEVLGFLKGIMTEKLKAKQDIQVDSIDFDKGSQFRVEIYRKGYEKSNVYRLSACC